MKIVIAAGGGGHFSPALALIEALPKDTEIVVLGRKYAFEHDKTVSFEYQTAQKLGIRFSPISTGKLQRTFTRYTIPFLFKTPYGLLQALKILRREKPNVVVSFGGYVSLPVVFAAFRLQIPIVIHEQVLHAGMANKLAARFATRVCLSWETSKPYFPKDKIVMTGNPLRKTIVASEIDPEIEGKITQDLPLLYITGGSGGSHHLNIFVEGCISKLLDHFTVVHQTGDAQEFHDFERLHTLRASLPQVKQERYLLQKFVDVKSIGTIFRRADLVISRSGINTVTELLYFGKPCLLIPLRYGQSNEQLHNAEFVQSVGIGHIFHEENGSAGSFYEAIMEMYTTRNRYLAHTADAKKIVTEDAIYKIIEVLMYVTKKTA